MAKTELYIHHHSIPQIEVDDNKNIASAVFYEPDGKVLIGSAAFAAARRHQQLHQLSRDFKIDLGSIEPLSASKRTKQRRLFETSSGQKKSVAAITSDFLREVLRNVNEWLAVRGAGQVAHIVVAEPLQMEDRSEWLSNYRRNLTRILGRDFAGKDFDRIALDEDSITFIPEPFAVFQYYRYGAKIPLLAQRAKINALVIDFGGGTFDTCVVETTKDGDISQTGRNSRPLGAASLPVGGFFVNRVIAEELFRKCVIAKTDSEKFRKGLGIYEQWRRNEIDLEAISDDYRHFLRNFDETVYLVEDSKLSLCRSIVNWGLDDGALSLRISIPLPKNPFSNDGQMIQAPFSAGELRDIFTRRIWHERLKGGIAQTLQRSKEELRGASISVVLLSGGSANIRWLEGLLQRDFAAELGEAEVFWLPDYQEVVCKGLAIECARRFNTKDGEGDFSSVTYNRLCLILHADNAAYTVKPFKPRLEGLPPVFDTPGVLLPSASVLRKFIGKPMKWRVQLGRSARRQLDYYFLRSSFDPADHTNLHNLVERTVYTPPDCSFDSHLDVELTVKEDGTAIPRFIYKSGRTEKDTIASTGKPFYLDMTYGKADTGATAYIGLDFGTSNTAVSFMDESMFQVRRQRSGEMALGDLVTTLPYPISAPLASYLGLRDPLRSTKLARAFIEAALGVASYIAYAEYCSKKGRGESKLFRGFTQRSAGPLWRLLQDCLAQLGKAADISAPFLELLTPESSKLLDQAINYVAQEKHDLVNAGSVDLMRSVQLLANISQKALSPNLFGYFEQVKRQRFAASRQYDGIFRIASGSPPFIRVAKFTGPVDFPDHEAFIASAETGNALSLFPLMFWNTCESHPDVDPGHCYLFDKQHKGEARFSFKAVGFPCTLEVTTENEYKAIAETLLSYKESDPQVEQSSFVSMQEISGD